MRHILKTATSCLLLVSLGCGSSDPADTPVSLTEQQLLERGKYLVTIGGCNDCHTPKSMTPTGPADDTAHYLAGYVGEPMDLGDFDIMNSPPGTFLYVMSANMTGFASMMGTAYSANITPDPSGIGAFTLDDFKRAFQQGKYRGQENGRPLADIMPWRAYAHMDSSDVRAIYTYLMKGVKPVSNVPPPPVMAAMPGMPPAGEN